MTCILRDDSPDLKWFLCPESELKELIINDLDSIFGIEDMPVEAVVTKWKKGIPLYSPTLYQSWFEIDEILKNNIPNRNLFGNYTGEISIRGMAQSSHVVYKNRK